MNDTLDNLFETLVTRFDEEELRVLCFDLSIDYEDLRGEGKLGKSRELIAYMERHGHLDRLVTILKQRRPDVAWPTEQVFIHVADLPREPLFAHPFPTQSSWAGQAQELEQLTAFWKHSDYRVVTIVGPSGLGKSSLARRWYQEFTKRDIQPDGFFWWNFRVQPDVDAFLTRALAYLTGGSYQRRQAPSVYAMVNDLISLLTEGRFLFMLDSLETMQLPPSQEQQQWCLIKDPRLLAVLSRWSVPQAHNSRCVVISRLALPKLEARTLDLQIRPLSIDESCTFLKAQGIKGSDDDLMWLAEPYDGYPGTLSHLTGYLMLNYKGDSQSPDVREILGTIKKALACASLEDVADWGNLADWDTLGGAEWISIVHLGNAAQTIKLYHERFERGERQALLYAALRGVIQADSRKKDETPFYIYFLIARVVTRWRDLIEAALEALRGKAKLKFRFLSDQAVFGEQTNLAIQVTNVGDETAEELNLYVTDAPAYQSVQTGPSQNYLSPGKSLVWEFSLHFTEDRPTDVKIAASYRQRGVEGTHVAEFSDVITPRDPRHFQFVPFPSYSNPYNPGPPVKKDVMFYGRESSVNKIIAELHGLHQDNIIVLYGQRRTGKTSLLYALRRRLPQDAVYLPVFFDAQGRGTPLSFFWGLATAIVDACCSAGLDVAEPGRADFEGDVYAQFEYGFLRPLVAKLDGRRLVLMLDEFESLEQSVKTLGDNIFPFFRHLMQHQEAMNFIFCGSHQLHELTRDYWSIFFNVARPIHVSFLDEDSTRALITEPVAGHFSYDELALRRLWTLTNGHPYFTQYLCYEMVKLMSEREKGYATIQDVNDTLEGFIKLGNDHMVSYVWQQSDAAQRAALLALLDVRQPAGERVAPRSRIARRVAQVHPEVAEDVGPALEKLIARELLWGDELRIGFTMELVAEWLQAKRSWYDLTGQLYWPGMRRAD